MKLKVLLVFALYIIVSVLYGLTYAVVYRHDRNAFLFNEQLREFQKLRLELALLDQYREKDPKRHVQDGYGWSMYSKALMNTYMPIAQSLATHLSIKHDYEKSHGRDMRGNYDSWAEAAALLGRA